jgi:hypothetical protein
VQRFEKVMSFKPVDRLPYVEWATWWDQTLTRWYDEGLPPALTDPIDIRRHFGLDCYAQLWIGPYGPSFVWPPNHEAGLITDEASYQQLKRDLYPTPAFNPQKIANWAAQQAAGDMVIWITLEGFFWHPRTLFGIEPHMYAFYDQPQLMHQINQDLLEFNLRAIDEFCSICTPNFMTFAEDMSYNQGPMLSREAFNEFLAPYYRRIVPELSRRGIIPMVDTDGEVSQLIPWLKDVGIEGILPLERRGGVDIAAIRQQHPNFKMIGGFDKTIMHLGPDAMRAEFDRLLPVMRTGGFIPCVDHQTPPDVSLDNYRAYVQLLKQYCLRAAQQ